MCLNISNYCLVYLLVADEGKGYRSAVKLSKDAELRERSSVDSYIAKYRPVN